MVYEDTICAPATSMGAGAISMIRVSGSDCFAVVDAVVCFKKGSAATARTYSLKYGEVKGLDDVVVGVYRAPNSYTGEDCAEICCHASSYIVSCLLDRLCAAGCRMAEAGEFTRRAFVNGKMDLAQAEAVGDMIAAASAAQHRVALNQLRGGYSLQLSSLRAKILELTTLLELELDFSEEDLQFASRGKLVELVLAALTMCRRLADSFKLGNAIRNGVPVAIVGAPNSGKSTLLNALLGDERAIVSAVAGTTRDTIEETCVVGGVLLRFIDTAGIRDASDEVEKMGIERTFAKIAQAEIVLGVVDVSGSDVNGEIEHLVQLAAGKKLIVLLNKVDVAASTARVAEKGVAACGAEVSDVMEKGATASGAEVLDVMEKGVAASGAEVSDVVEEGVGVCDEGAGKEDVDVCDHKVIDDKSVTSLNEYVKDINNKGIDIDLLAISAKNGQGLDELRSKIVERIGIVSEDAILVTNIRHAEALRTAAESLSAVQCGLELGTPADLLAEDLREAIRVLGTITGEISSTEVLNTVFKRFCIGK